jgi:hypothetical protein
VAVGYTRVDENSTHMIFPRLLEQHVWPPASKNGVFFTALRQNGILLEML